jgi:AAA domain
MVKASNMTKQKKNKKLEKKLKLIEKQVKHLTKIVSKVAGTAESVDIKPKTKKDNNNFHTIESQIKALTEAVTQLVESKKEGKTSDPKGKEEEVKEEQAAPATFSTYKFTFYVKPKAGSKRYKSVKTIPDPDDSTVLLYAVKDKRMVLQDSLLTKLPLISYIGTEAFEQLTETLIQHGKNDTDQSEKIENILNNLGSVLAAIETTREGNSTLSEVEEGYETNTPLAADASISAIRHRFIENKVLFGKQPLPKMGGKVAFKSNSCLATAIISTFQSTFWQRKKIRLNYEMLWDICRPDEPYPESNEYQLTLEQAKRFFQLYKLKLVALDAFDNVLMYYDPLDELLPGTDRRAARNKMSPNILRLLVHQRHAFKLDHDWNSFDQTVEKTTTATKEMKLSNKYYLRKEPEEDDRETHTMDKVFLHTKEQIQSYIKSYDNTRNVKYVKVMTGLDMDTLLLELQEEFGIVGSHLKTKGGIVSSFQLEQKKVVFDICSVKRIDAQPNQSFENEDDFTAYMQAYETINRALLNERNMSKYHPQFQKVMDYYVRGPLSGMFVDDPTYTEKPGPSLDIIKAYTALLLQLKHFPVGDPFTVFRKYKQGTEIKDLRFYLVHKDRCNQIQADLILFDKKYVLVSGITLKEIQAADLDCTILYEWRPIRYIPNTMRQHIQALWSNQDLTMDQKKEIMNINIGCLDKKRNRRTRAEFFHDRKEAIAKQKTMPKSQMMAIHVNKTVDKEGLDYKVDIEEEPRQHDDLYLVINQRERTLQEGFLPISFLKYDLQRLVLWRMYNTLEKAGFSVVGVNTDSLFVAHHQADQLKQFTENPKNADLFQYNSAFEAIGKWRFQDDKRCRRKQIVQQENELNVDDVWTEPITVYEPEDEDQWESSATYLTHAHTLMEHDNIMVQSAYPGSGKSHLVKTFVADKQHVIVHPYNNQVQSMKKNDPHLKFKTTCRLLGMGVGHKKKKPLNVAEMEVIVFDEIYLNDREMLWQIHTFMQTHPHIRFLATGDPYQLKSIEKSKNLRSNAECIRAIFPKRLQLDIVKRVQNEADRQGYVDIWQALFKDDRTIQEVCEENEHLFAKPTKSLNQLKTSNSLSLTNDTRQIVNQYVLKNIEKRSKITAGQHMICKGYVPQIDHVYNNTEKGTKRKNLTKNRVYTVSCITKKEVVLKDDSKNCTITLTRKLFDEHFDLPYCTTTHAAIGLTITDPITLFDWDSSQVSKEWFWTAITRTTSLNLISFYTGNEIANEKQRIKELERLIQKKLDSHKRYDVERNIHDKKHFVTVQWVMKELQRTQWICAEQGCEMMQHSGNRQWSIDRIDNDLGHTKYNCRIICISCNKAKH